MITREEPFHKNLIGMSKVALCCALAMAFSGPIVAVAMFPVIGLWAGLAIFLVFPGSIFVGVGLEDKARYSVRNAIGDEALGNMKFADAALRYLGHETRRVSEHVIVVNESSLVYVRYWLDALDMEAARKAAEKEGISSVFAVESRFGKSYVQYSAYRLAEKHDITIYDWNDVFDAVYERIKSNMRTPAKQLI